MNAAYNDLLNNTKCNYRQLSLPCRAEKPDFYQFSTLSETLEIMEIWMNITAKRSSGFQNDQVLKENQLGAGHENSKKVRATKIGALTICLACLRAL